MTVCPNKKNRIDLSAYSYQEDIENRIFLANLSFFEVDVLQEIVDGSLKTTITDLADNLGVTKKTLQPLLEKLAKIRLFQVQGEALFIDKEKRKYFENHLQKFDENFKPGIEFLQSLLSKVPLDVLLVWYPVCRSAESIFKAIIEKCLLTPKLYERYLKELEFEDSIINAIIDEIYQAKDYKISSKSLAEKFQLTPQKLQQYLLHLEYNFVACSSYQKNEGFWEEIITPFHEWREFLRHVKQTEPRPVGQVKPLQEGEFPFLKALEEFIHCLTTHSDFNKNFESTQLLQTAQFLGLTEQKSQNKWEASATFTAWTCKDITEQAVNLYKQTFQYQCKTSSYGERDIREIEKSLKRIQSLGWVYYEDFEKTFNRPLGSSDCVTLQKKGKHWQYVFPSYTSSDLSFLKYNLCERLFQAGMVDLGQSGDKLCIRLTPFGKIALFE